MDDKWWQWRARRRTPASAVDVPAQAIYDAMVKEVLSPSFREMGLKGSGGRYSWASQTCWALMSLQKSAYSDAVEIQFTVNLLVANKQQWEAARSQRTYLPERPSAGTIYGDPAAQERIGMVQPDRADKWWRIHPEVDLAAVTTDVLNDTREFAIPWLRQQVEGRGGAD
ncbi:DUF4304 domain-containing protein [Actinopolymorpha sp. B9G3]|uniref:DUF4304 domain-containing protein n=1 Tax=Actinopolymorpha sp. B9G3 TaxID=3158970 RepID=UPI0032D92AA2